MKRPRPAAWAVLYPLLLLLAALAPPPWAGAAPPPPPASITVVSDDNYPPYIMLTPEGHPQGILVDQWRLWEKKTGVKVRLIAIAWNEAQKLMAQGAADVIDTMFVTESRKKSYDFSKPWATLEVPIFFHKNIGGITDVPSLMGFTVGVKAGDACVEVLRENGIQTLKLYDSYQEVIEAAAQGEVKVFCVDKPPALYYLYKMNLETEFRQSISLYSGRFHRAVRKGSDDLLRLVEDGFARITPEEYEAIDRKWMGSSLGEASVNFLYLLYALGAAVMVGLGLVAWNQALRRKVAQRTAELRATLESLQASEEKRRIVLDESSDPIFSFERDGTYRFVNKAFAAPFDRSPEEIIGKKIWDLFPPEEARRRFLVVGEVFEHGQTRVIEVRVPRPDGDLFFVTSVKPVKDEQGNVVSVICISKDITQRKHDEEALKESEERFRVLSEESPLGISLISQDGRYEYLNPAFIKMFGYTLEDLPSGEDWFRLAYPDPDYRRQVQRSWQEDLDAFPAGESRPRTFQVRCKDGGAKTVLFLPVTISSGRQFVLYVDMTERLRAEQARLESERRYRELFDSIDDFVYTHDVHGKLLAINQAACRGMGASREDLLGSNLGQLMAPEYRKAFLEEYLPELLTKGQKSGVAKCRTRDGGVRYIEYRNRLVREQGKEPYISGAGRDVTDRVVAERELRRLQEQLLSSQKIEAVGVLAGGIAHDFNNVLQAISGYAQLVLAENNLSPTGRERLESIGRSIERAASMIKQLMTLAHKVETRRERVDLNQEVGQTVAILEHTLPRMIAIRAQLEPALGAVSGDPGQMEQVMLNLANNASHAMPQGGELAFRTRNVHLNAEDCRSLPGLRPGDYVALEVADTGLGMDEETKSHIFEPFFTTKSPGEGTGLGLSTVYGIVANHGGQILCRSRPHQGTTFTIYFPRAKDEEGRAPEPPKPASVDYAGDETILLVDDELSILDACREALRGFGYRVLTATRGEEALDIFLPDPAAIALVVMDLNMPGMGGLDCMKAMLAASPRSKVMVATGYAEPGILEDIAVLGGVGLISKPYRFSDLLASVRRALDQD